MAKQKKERPKKYADKVKTDKSFADLIKISVTGNYVKSRTKDRADGNK